jgi:5-(carboxyamino)imidazole ribonucleotide mutase
MSTIESPDRPRVAVVYGSASDAQTMSKAGATLQRFGVAYEEAVLSAHRAPRTLADWVEGLRGRGVEVVIAGAGLAAALPGTVAALTTLPVIGVPISGGALDGMDSMLAIAQMPPGVAVATVGLNNATNAAVLAVQILALADQRLAGKLETYKQDFERAAADGLARSTASAGASA